MPLTAVASGIPPGPDGILCLGWPRLQGIAPRPVGLMRCTFVPRKYGRTRPKRQKQSLEAPGSGPAGPSVAEISRHPPAGCHKGAITVWHGLAGPSGYPRSRVRWADMYMYPRMERASRANNARGARPHSNGTGTASLCSPDAHSILKLRMMPLISR
jgi:hypothetical protein